MMPNIAELLVQVSKKSERRLMMIEQLNEKIEQLEAEIKRLTEELAKSKNEKG